MQLSCPTCGHECGLNASSCPACGASLTVALLSLELDPERSTAYQRLLEIYDLPNEPEGKWDELEIYLQRELAKYADFTSYDWLEETQRLESVGQGLELLLESLQELRNGHEALEKAARGNALLCRGRELLLEVPEAELLGDSGPPSGL